MVGPFKMKGSPFQRNFGIGSPAKTTDEKVVKGVTKKTVDVSGGDKPERHSDKYRRVKKETSAMTGADKLANLSKEYSGTWTREDRSEKDGSKGTFVNEKGETVREASINQGQAYNRKKKAYKAANTTK